MRARLYKVRRAFGSGDFLIHLVFDSDFRMRLSLFFGLIFNLFYLVFNLVFGLFYKSIAPLTVSVYYALIITVRYIILRLCDGESTIEMEREACKKGGLILLLADLVITVTVIYSVRSAAPKSYGILVFSVLSLHAIFTVTRAVMGIFSRRENPSLTDKAIYTVRLAACASSVFNISSAAALRFSNSARLSEILIMIFGTFVSVSVLFLSFSMLFSVNTERKI